MSTRARIPLLIVVLTLAACGGDGSSTRPTGAAASGEVTASSASAAVEALCRMAATRDVADAKATFYDDAHVTLHAIAAAANENQVGSDADLLITMQRIEAELEEPSLPSAYADDIQVLRLATVDALEGVGIDVAGC